MKCRLDPKRIRFRITKEELSQLQIDKTLSETIIFPNHQALRYTIHLQDANHPFALTYDQNNIILSVPETHLALLSKAPPKEGIKNTLTLGENPLVFSLEIDILEPVCF